MKKRFRLYALLLGLCMLLPILAACKGGGSGDVTTEVPDPGNQLSADRLFWRTVLAEPGAYRIIRSQNADSHDSKMSVVLQGAIQILSGQIITVRDDSSEAQPAEIVLGNTARAGVTYQSAYTGQTLAEGSFVIEYFDKTAVIHYGGFAGLVAAIRQIVRYLAEPGGKDAEAVFDTMIKKTQVSPGNIQLNNTYANGMIFQQNQPAVVRGSGDAGVEVLTELVNAEGQVLATQNAVVDGSGIWSAELPGQVGSYAAYQVRVSVSGIVVASLNDVVFGEVWVATGQSNMNYTLIKDIEFKNLIFDDSYLRIMQIGKPSAGFSIVPLTENSNVSWFSGNNSTAMQNTSAVAYYYASVLRRELDMPVGIIHYSVGGTPVRSWLSAKTIEANPDLKEYYLYKGSYITDVDYWDPAGYRQATALYNTMGCIAEDFHVAGMLWYQGEQDTAENSGNYLNELDIFYRQYCEAYGYSNYDMPFIYALMVPYRANANPTHFGPFTAEFATFAQKYPKVSAIAHYDQDPYFNNDNNASHPNSKRLVGERMAVAALSSAYGGSDPISSPYPTGMRVEGNAIIVSFANTADGLTLHSGVGEDSILRGFTVCGSDGVYVMANAEIISKTEVKVWSDSVAQPVSVTYAYELLQRNCNLACEKNGELLYMAVPFALNRPANAQHTSYFLWMTCDFDTQWRISHSPTHYGADYKVWADYSSPAGAKIELSLDQTNKYSGSSALRVEYKGSGEFGVGPNTTGIGYNGSETTFNDTYNDLSKYSKLVFYVRNDGNAPVTFERLSIKMGTAALDASSECADGVIPADGKWHRIVVDLTAITDFVGNVFDSSYLKGVTQFKFYFSCTADGALLLDQFDFIP